MSDTEHRLSLKLKRRVAQLDLLKKDKEVLSIRIKQTARFLMEEGYKRVLVSSITGLNSRELDSIAAEIRADHRPTVAECRAERLKGKEDSSHVSL